MQAGGGPLTAMETFVQLVESMKQKHPYEILLRSDGSMRQNIAALGVLDSFVHMSIHDLLQLAPKSFVILSELQYAVRDLTALKTLGRRRLLASYALATDIAHVRKRVEKCAFVAPLNVFGSREPFESKYPAPNLTADNVAAVRYIHDVLHASRYICFEARNFAQEARAWRMVCGPQEPSAILLPITDWTLPTSAVLAELARHVDAAIRERRFVFTHCIAGKGRTGTCVAFLLSCALKIFNIPDVIIEVARLYNPIAAREMARLVYKGVFSVQKMHDRFRRAANYTRTVLGEDSLLSVDNFPDVVYPDAHFSTADRRKLEAAGLLRAPK